MPAISSAAAAGNAGAEGEQSTLGLERETYERVGLVAHALGMLRQQNPYLPAEGTCLIDPRESETLRRLAEHWWRGWDSWGPGAGRRRNC